MTWSERKLGELISVKHGWAFKGEFFSEDGKYLLLTPGNAYETGGLKLRPGKEKYYTGEFPTEFLLKTGDMLVVMTDLVQAAPILGGAILIPEDDVYLHNQRLGLVQYLKKASVDQTFLYYLLNSPVYRSQVRGSASGATVRHTAPKRISDCCVLVPDTLETQQKIGTILSSYDELISTNKCQISLLEEAARNLYREWFVKLRFPGHESVKIKDGLPEGWEKGCAHDFVSILSGGTPKTGIDQYWHGDIPFFTPKDCPETYFVLQTEKALTDVGLANCNSKLFPKHTTFITARGTVGKVVMAQSPMAMNQSCYALAPKGAYNALFLFLAIKEGVEHFKQVAVGGVFDAIVVDTFKVIPFTLPDGNLISEFGSKVQPLFDQIEALLLQNQSLRHARDLLLPRLMSGKIKV